MLHKICASLLVAVLGAAASQAATLTITANVPKVGDYYVPQFGQSVTFTVWGDDEGAIGAYYSLFGRLEWTAPLDSGFLPPTQSPVGTGWIVGHQPQGSGFIHVFDQLNFDGGTGDLLAPGGSPFATFSLLINYPGIISLDWDDSTLLFFDLTSAPGILISPSDYPIPEPSTHLLVALGLLALAMHRRKEDCSCGR